MKRMHSRKRIDRPCLTGLPFRSTALLFAAAACALPGRSSAGQTDPSAVPLVRVRTIAAAPSDVASVVTLTGDIQARYLSDISFQTGGKIATRTVEVGQHVTPDQVLATLDTSEERADVDNARATLESAEAVLNQAQLTFDRQSTLLKTGFTTRPAYDKAEQDLRTSQAAVDSAKAALGTVGEQLSYTSLKAGVAGIVTGREGEVGQVVQAGQPIFNLAQDGPRDAVFNIYEALLADPSEAKPIDVSLQARPDVHVEGTVREISPIVDPGPGTVRVKVGLPATAPGMTLGAIVTGTGRFKIQRGTLLPWGALFRSDDRPAVWVVDPKDHRVSVKIVKLDRFTDDAMVISDGLAPGDSVVMAGVQFLRPGQVVDPIAGPTE